MTVALMLMLCPLSQAQTTRPIGVNLEGMSDYMSADMLMDLVKTARPFGKVTAAHINGADAVRRDDAGWPLEDAGIVLFAARPSDQDRAFRFRFTGKADVRITPGGAGKVTSNTYDPATNISEGTIVGAKNQSTLNMNFSNTNGGIRDLQVLRDEPAAGAFTQRFIDRLAPFKGQVLRYMDLQGTNGSAQTTWESRTKPEHKNWRNNMPVEVLVELTERADVHPWFCMPHQADDGYVRAFATYIRDHLGGKRTIYVEYSNETWNTQFAQARYAREQGLKMGLDQDPYNAQLRYHGLRTAQIGRIWREVFAEKPTQHTLVIVLGTQAAGMRPVQQSLTPDGVQEAIDAIAIAPYMGGSIAKELGDKLTTTPIETIHDMMRAELAPDGRVDRWINAHTAYAKSIGKRLIAYEAGQHLVADARGGRNPDAINHLIAVNRHPGMEGLYKQYLDLWFSHNPDVICLFNFTFTPRHSGSWGLLETLDQSLVEAHKYRAVVQSLQEPLPPVRPANLPSTRPATGPVPAVPVP